MQPFFPYYGGKLKLATDLGPPQRDHVIEPFAGSAGYSVFWEPPHVTLIERDPVVFGVWDYLQKAAPAELLRLPSNISSLNQLPPQVCQEARWLVGFWLNHGLARPAVRRSNWARQARYHGRFWSKTVKLRIASQLDGIRHWDIRQGNYEEAPDIEAHWHIDPPYQRAGYAYKCNHIDYPDLAEWCQSRKGFVQVCENESADWLPFEKLVQVNNSGIRKRSLRRGLSVEMIYEVET
jgi:hypothetical protein